MNETKKWWKSKTIWFNVASFLLALGSVSTEVMDILPDSWSALATPFFIVVTALGNIILRTITRKGVTK